MIMLLKNPSQPSSYNFQQEYLSMSNSTFSSIVNNGLSLLLDLTLSLFLFWFGLAFDDVVLFGFSVSYFGREGGPGAVEHILASLLFQCDNFLNCYHHKVASSSILVASTMILVPPRKIPRATKDG